MLRGSRRGQGTAHAARPRSGESARSRRSQEEKLHGSTRSDHRSLFSSLSRSLFLNNISLVGGLGFIIIIVIIILSVIFVVVVAAAAAPVNLSPSLSLRVFLIFGSPCAGLNAVFCFVCLAFFVLVCFGFFLTRLMFSLGSAVEGLREAARSSLIFL